MPSARATAVVPPKASISSLSVIARSMSHTVTLFKWQMPLVTWRDGFIIEPMPKSTKPQALRRDVGTRIALLREAVALTQEQMADALAVARNTLAMWETGARTPDLNAMIRLSERFDVSLDYVYKGSLTALRADLRTQLVGLEGARRTRAAAN